MIVSPSSADKAFKKRFGSIEHEEKRSRPQVVDLVFDPNPCFFRVHPWLRKFPQFLIDTTVAARLRWTLVADE